LVGIEDPAILEDPAHVVVPLHFLAVLLDGNELPRAIQLAGILVRLCRRAHGCEKDDMGCTKSNHEQSTWRAAHRWTPFPVLFCDCDWGIHHAHFDGPNSSRLRWRPP